MIAGLNRPALIFAPLKSTERGCIFSFIGLERSDGIHQRPSHSLRSGYPFGVYAEYIIQLIRVSG